MKPAKFIAFAAAAALLSLVVVCSGIFGAECYLHHRYENVAAPNMRGYRGPVAHHKRADEIRVAVLGGSTVFGYGIGWKDAFPAQLERDLAAQWPSKRGRVNVINLGCNGEGSYALKYALDDYAYLDYDAVIIYAGYNDLGRDNYVLARRGSPIFRAFGYLPIFPLIFKEKAMALRYGGNIEAAYWKRQTVFRPNVAARATASALETATRISQTLEAQITRYAEEAENLPSAPATADGCAAPWTFFCGNVRDAVDFALAKNVPVLIVTQPYMFDYHGVQQEAILAMLGRRYGNDPRVRYAEAGSGVVDLNDRGLCYDGMHLTGAGNALLATRLVEPVVELLSTAPAQAPAPVRTVSADLRTL